MARYHAHRKTDHRLLSERARLRRRSQRGEMSPIAPEEEEELALLEAASLEAGEAYLRDQLASLTEEERADYEELRARREAQARGELPPGAPAADFRSELLAAMEHLRENEGAGADDVAYYDDGASWWVWQRKAIPAHTAGNGRGRPGRMRRNASYLPCRRSLKSRR